MGCQANAVEWVLWNTKTDATKSNLEEFSEEELFVKLTKSKPLEVTQYKVRRDGWKNFYPAERVLATMLQRAVKNKENMNRQVDQLKTVLASASHIISIGTI